MPMSGKWIIGKSFEDFEKDLTAFMNLAKNFLWPYSEGSQNIPNPEKFSRKYNDTFRIFIYKLSVTILVWR